MSSEVIDLTDLPSDDEDDTLEGEASIVEGEEDEDAGTIDEAAFSQLLLAIETTPEARLRTVLAKLVESDHAVQLALFEELVTIQSERRKHKRSHSLTVVPRYVICANCDEDFDVGDEHEEDECVYHHGNLEVDYQAFADHDEDIHGPMDTDENRRQFPENFVWSCCEEDGTSEGCLKTVHTVGNKKRRI